MRAVIVQSGEPLLTMGGARKAYEAFTSPNLELLVVMDFWKTPTAQLADYVLPAADFLERPDITLALGDRQLLRRRAEVGRAALRAPQRLRAVGRPRQAPARPGRVAGDARGDARHLPRAVREDVRGVGERRDEPLLHPAPLAQVRGEGLRHRVREGRARAEHAREARRRPEPRLHRAPVRARRRRHDGVPAADDPRQPLPRADRVEPAPERPPEADPPGADHGHPPADRRRPRHRRTANGC